MAETHNRPASWYKNLEFRVIQKTKWNATLSLEVDWARSDAAKTIFSLY
jgi:hypothetical protein